MNFVLGVLIIILENTHFLCCQLYSQQLSSNSDPIIPKIIAFSFLFNLLRCIFKNYIFIYYEMQQRFPEFLCCNCFENQQISMRNFIEICRMLYVHDKIIPICSGILLSIILSNIPLLILSWYQKPDNLIRQTSSIYSCVCKCRNTERKSEHLNSYITW